MPDHDLLLYNGRFATLDPQNPHADAVLIRDGRIRFAGSEREARLHAGARPRSIDLGGRRGIPGLIDNHIHAIRGALGYSLELRWDGVPTLIDAMSMLKRQAAMTPPPHWVRVVGGFTEHQFAEKRLPTIEEINTAAPETPVFILHLNDRALLNRAALRAVGTTKEMPDPPGGQIARDAAGAPAGLVLARPNAMILDATLAQALKLPFDQQLTSTRLFMRELNSFGVTSVIDAGGASQNFPEDYEVVQKLHADGQLTMRIAYNLSAQRPKDEFAEFRTWTKHVALRGGDDFYRINGAGGVLVYNAADFANFRAARPELPPKMEAELEPVVRLLAERRWPWRFHATYNETITRVLDVFEKVNREVPFDGLHWFIDHAETIDERNIERIAALGGGIAVQDRMAFQGEYFAERYGFKAAEHTPPVAKMLAAGVPVGAGTDAPQLASYNPWVSLSWFITGRTVGGLKLYPPANCLDRETALRLWTEANTWFSDEEGKKGRIAAGQLADLAVLSSDYFSVPKDDIAHIRSVLTVVGGKVVHGSGEFASLAPPLPPPAPEWSPPATFGGYQRRASAAFAGMTAHRYKNADSKPADGRSA